MDLLPVLKQTPPRLLPKCTPTECSPNLGWHLPRCEDNTGLSDLVLSSMEQSNEWCESSPRKQAAVGRERKKLVYTNCRASCIFRLLPSSFPSASAVDAAHELLGFDLRRSSRDNECRVVCARTLALASARLDERAPNHNARRTERRTRRAASASRAGCASEHLSRCSRSLSDADPAAAASSWTCGWTCGSRASHSAPSCCRAALTEAIACAASNSLIQAVTQQRGQTRRSWCAQLTCRISRHLFGHSPK